MRLARVLSGIGKVLIWAGTIVLLFVAYQLWGTNLAEARAQDGLEDDFAALLSSTTTTSSTTSSTTSTTGSTTTTTTPAPPPPPAGGDAVARIVIPRIGVDKIVVEGISRDDLKKGPGHYPGTPLPGQPGNSAIAGHRTTYGAPFHRVDELAPGDEILVTTLQGEFRYEVTGQRIVAPSEVEVVNDQGDDRLTLTACHPKYSARQRIVIFAKLLDDPAPPQAPIDPDVELEPGELPDEPVEEPADEPADEQAIDTLDSGETRTAEPAIRWGAITAGVWIAFYLLSRRWRRWPSYVLGAPVFGVCLFIFFGAFSELLPSNF